MRPLSAFENRITLAIIAVLILNSINSIAFNTMQICIRFTTNIKNYDKLVEVWTIFSEFFYDLLTLINGLALLRLYQHISEKTTHSDLNSINMVLNESEGIKLFNYAQPIKTEYSSGDKALYPEVTEAPASRRATPLIGHHGNHISSLNSDDNSFLVAAFRQRLSTRYKNKLQSFLAS